jgi:hypothetical protein
MTYARNVNALFQQEARQRPLRLGSRQESALFTVQ